MKKSNTDFPARIIFEDNHLLVIDKLSGELAQGDATGDEDLLVKGKRYIGEKYNKPGNVFLGLPHRLDRPTSGVVILCRTTKALQRVSIAFKERNTDKVYHCMVEGHLTDQSAKLVHYLAKNAKNNKSYCVEKSHSKGKEAALTYTVLRLFDRYTLLEICLHTGRHHQIRAQLAAIGHCVKGDVKYGARRGNGDGSICLHAYRLTLKHPVTKDDLRCVSKQYYLAMWGFI